MSISNRFSRGRAGQSPSHAGRGGESGYSLLMVVFLVATSLILSSVVLPNLLTQGRRDREEEMVWRGEQYERAIGLYFRKFGKYPTKIDDLTKQTNGVRFLRQAYADPMNKDDGSWRFIYVGPNGQLIGSVKSQSLLQSTLTASALPGASLFGGIAQPQSPPGQGMTAGSASAPGTPGSGQAGQLTGNGLAPNPLEAQPQGSTGSIIGGNIIGVGSKVKQPSLRVYFGGDTYEKWEFIWNPLLQGAIPGQQAVPVAPAAPPATATPPQSNQQALPGTQPQQTPTQTDGSTPPVTQPQ